jgi:hypothetical protein
MTSISKYFYESEYAEARKRENFRDMIAWAKSPSYFKPMTTGMPSAEKGRCCLDSGKWYHFISHNLP